MNFKRAIKALDAEDADLTLASFLVNEASSYMAGRGFAELVREPVPQAELDHTAVKKYLAACIAVLTPAVTAETPAVLTPPEIARRLKKSPDAVLAWIKAGQLKASNLSKGRRPRYVVSETDLDAFLKTRQPEPPTPRKRTRKVDLPGDYRRYSA